MKNPEDMGCDFTDIKKTLLLELINYLKNTIYSSFVDNFTNCEDINKYNENQIKNFLIIYGSIFLYLFNNKKESQNIVTQLQMSHSVYTDREEMPNIQEKNILNIMKDKSIGENYYSKILLLSRRLQNTDVKKRIYEINNEDYRKKKILINRLKYLIYFILCSIVLGLCIVMKIISVKTFAISFGIVLIVILYTFITSEKFIKEYGSESEKIAKGLVKGYFDVFPYKCPDNCSKK